MVGDKTHRIDGFPGRSGRDQHLFPRQVLDISDLLADMVKEHLRLRHLPRAGVPAGQMAMGGIDHLHPVSLADLQVILEDRRLIHPGVHGRGDQLRALAGQGRGGQHIVADPMGQLADHIGCGRGHQEEIRLFSQGHMLHVELEGPVKGIYHTFMAGQGLEGGGCDKIRGILRHQYKNVRPALDQHTGQVGDLIGRDPAGHA